MKKEEKERIVEAAKRYMTEKGISQNDLQKQSKVTYLSSMMNGVFTYKNSRTNEQSEIPEKWFVQLAEAVGCSVNVELFPMVITDQTIEILDQLEEAKANAYTRTLIGSTGCGKTYNVEKFFLSNPIGTYVITCNKSDTLESLIDKIIETTNISCNESKNHKRLRQIRIDIRKRYRDGEQPILIFDEAENLTINTIGMMKALYDYLENVCAFTLLGTPKLISKLEQMCRRDADGAPQFYSRLKWGIRYLKEIDRSFDRFFEGKEITADAKKLIRKECETYRDVRNCLIPVLKAANGQPVTADLIRIIHKL